jgi:hypothetical protein
MLASYLHAETDGVRDLGGWPLLQNKRFCWSAWWFKPAEHAWVAMDGAEVAKALLAKRHRERTEARVRAEERQAQAAKAKAEARAALRAAQIKAAQAKKEAKKALAKGKGKGKGKAKGAAVAEEPTSAAAPAAVAEEPAATVTAGTEAEAPVETLRLAKDLSPEEKTRLERLLRDTEESDRRHVVPGETTDEGKPIRTPAVVSWSEVYGTYPAVDDPHALTRLRLKPEAAEKVIALGEPMSGDPAVVGRLPTDPRGPMLLSRGMR